jgi:hypothetical protein
VVEQPCRARIIAIGDARERYVQRVGVERIEEKHDQIAGRIVRDPCVIVHQANVAATQTARACSREILFGDFVETGRDLDSDDLFEWILGGEDHRAPHPRTDVDERGVGYRRAWHACKRSAKIGDWHGFIVCRMRAGIADRLGLQVGEEEHRVRGNTVVVIESPSAAARLSHA